MHPISVIVAALAASAAAFDPDEALAHPQMKRALLEPRQTGLGGALGGLSDLSPSCTSALLGLYTSLPTPPANLGQALRGNGGGGGGNGGGGGGGNNPCSANLPSSLSSDFSSYSSDVRSWFDDNSAEVSSVFSSCSQISRYESLLPVCVSSFIGGAAAGGNSASATATATTTDTSSGGSGASSSSTGSSGSESTSGSAGGSDSSGAGASREAGAAVMALVAVGVFAAAL